MILTSLVSSRRLATGLKDTVEQMLGKQIGFLTLSNRGLGERDRIAKITKVLLEEQNPTPLSFLPTLMEEAVGLLPNL